MSDLQRVLPDYDPLDQQLQDPLSLRERRLVEAAPHSLAERLDVRPDRLRRLPLGLQSLLLITLRDENMTSSLNLFTAGLQLGQVEHTGLIGVDQPLFLPVEPLQLDLPPLDRGTAVVPRLR